LIQNSTVLNPFSFGNREKESRSNDGSGHNKEFYKLMLLSNSFISSLKSKVYFEKKKRKRTSSKKGTDTATMIMREIKSENQLFCKTDRH
jgi:hypothetical protein